MSRLTAALGVYAGLFAAMYVAACVLPGGPSDAARIQFTLGIPDPYHVPLAGVVEPLITISADGQVLTNPAYRLESLDPNVVRVDSTERRLLGVARGTASVRVVYPTATGEPDTVFTVRVVVAQVAVDVPTLTTRLGDTTRLTATAIDAGGVAVPSVVFTWSSSNPLVARVTQTGLVTAMNEGTVAITAETDSVEGLASITVIQVAAQVRLSPKLDTLRTVGSSILFIALAFDSSSNLLRAAKPRWTSSDTRVVTVDRAGRATAESAGTARIIAWVGGAADTATLVVAQVVRLLTVTPGFDTLTAIADTGRVEAVAFDSGNALIPNPMIAWATSDTTIATVDQTGLVRAATNGVVLVTASAASRSAFATVVVRQEVVTAQLSAHTVALVGAGDTMRLGAVGLDRNHYPVPDAAFGWRSGFECVASVAAGLVTARGRGATVITVTPANGSQSDTTTVSVERGPPTANAQFAFESARGIEVLCEDKAGLLIADASDPAWSPDGNRLAFARGCAIYAASADGSADRMVSDPGIGSASCDLNAAWSPDGTKIAFTRDSDPQCAWDCTAAIYVVNADGSNAHQVVPTSLGYRYSPTWSPDGTKLAFSCGGGINIMNADGSGGSTGLPSPGPGQYAPAWSPDGSLIAFSSGTPEQEIWVMNPDGSGARELTPHGFKYGARNPAWSPDGARLVFAASDVQSDLYVINRDGTGLQRLTSTPDYEDDPAWRATGAAANEGRVVLPRANAPIRGQPGLER